jgi:hypothetical protein
VLTNSLPANILAANSLRKKIRLPSQAGVSLPVDQRSRFGTWYYADDGAAGIPIVTSAVPDTMNHA